MTRKSDAKFKEKLPCGFKYGMRHLANFHPTNQKSENLFTMSFNCSKYTKCELQKYRGIIFHDTEQLCKIWIKPDLVVLKMEWGIGRTFIRTLKSLKNCTLMSSFCPKHTIFQQEPFIVSWHWREKQNVKGKLTLG